MNGDIHIFETNEDISVSNKHAKSVLNQAVTKAYNEGYQQGKIDAKTMLLDAFRIWDDALVKIEKETRR